MPPTLARALIALSLAHLQTFRTLTKTLSLSKVLTGSSSSWSSSLCWAQSSSWPSWQPRQLSRKTSHTVSCLQIQLGSEYKIPQYRIPLVTQTTLLFGFDIVFLVTRPLKTSLDCLFKKVFILRENSII